MPEILATETHNIHEGCEATIILNTGEAITGQVKAVYKTDSDPSIEMQVLIQDKFSLLTFQISIPKVIH